MTTTFRLIVCASLVAVLFPSCQSARLAPDRGLTEQDLAKFKDAAQRQASLMEHGLLLHLKTGEKLPLKINLKGDIIATAGTVTVPLRVQRDCTVFCAPPSQARRAKLLSLSAGNALPGVFISYDGQHYTHVLQSTRGEFDVSLNRNSLTGPEAGLNLAAWAK
jgi:hypothetical protein